jgi:hypothetical protein
MCTFYGALFNCLGTNKRWRGKVASGATLVVERNGFETVVRGGSTVGALVEEAKGKSCGSRGEIARGGKVP